MNEQTDHSQVFVSHWVKVQSAVSGLINSAITNRHDVEDVIQEVAVTAARDFAQYDRSRPFMPWIMTITRHRIIDFHRKSKRGRVVFDDQIVELLSDAAVRVSSVVTDREAALEVCMDELPRRGRRILEMRYHLGMTSQTIARHLGLSSSAVFSALHRLRLSLGKCIEGRLNVGVGE